MIRGLIFDLGNVLLRHDNDRLCREVAALTNGRSSAGDVRRAVYDSAFGDQINCGMLSAEEMHAWFVDQLGLQGGFSSLTAAMNSIFSPQPGIESLIERLVGRYRLVVLSNINPIHAAHVRATLPVLGRFDEVHFSCELGAAKPDARAFAAAVQAARAPAAQCLFTDDLPVYVEAALARGLQAFTFTGVAAAEAELRRWGVL